MNILFFSHYLGTATTTFIHNDFVNVGNTPNFTASYLCLKYENKNKNNFTSVFELPLQRSDFEMKIRWKLELYNLYLGFKNKAFGIQANEILQKTKPAIIHCNFGYEALTLLENCYNTKQEYVVHFHGYDASQKLKCKAYVNYLKKYAAYSNVHFLAVSNFMKNELLATGIKPYNVIEIIYYGVNTNFFSPNATPANISPYTFLQVSGITPKKGHIYTLQAFNIFQQQNPTLPTKLIIAGKDFMHGAVHNFATNNNLMRNVEFIGEVSPTEIKQLMQNANCFVHHSITSVQNDKEGVPNTIIEAMAMNLPVIATLHAGIPELVTNTVNGLLVPEKDIEAYSKAMQAMATGQHHFSPRESILPKFSSVYHTQQLINLYNSIAVD